MNCPHCQQEIPANYSVEWCPWCGKDLVVQESESSKPPVWPVRTNWFVFFAVFLAPPVLTMIAVTVGNGELILVTALYGSPMAGLVCGLLVARRLFPTTGLRVLFTLAFTAAFGFVIFWLSFAGCVLVSDLQNKNLH